MRLPTKEDLAMKFGEFPLVRLMIYEPWFRVVFGGLALSGLFLASFLPKMWLATPEDFKPEIRISGLDMAQAWSLKRAAVRLTAAKDWEAACYSWRSAYANHPGREDLSAGFLKAFVDGGAPRAYIGAALQQAQWLLALTGTNLAALELAVPVFELTGHHAHLVTLLESRKDSFTPAIKHAYLKAVFQMGRKQDFGSQWDLVGGAGDDPEMALYQAAYLAGWGPVSKEKENLAKLEAAMEDPALQVTAARLILDVAAVRSDVNGYYTVLRQLASWNADSLTHHAGYWKLLASNSRQAEALELARAQPHAVSSITELAELVRFFAGLEAYDDAVQALKRAEPIFGGSSDYWISYADLLLRAKRWDDLRQVAVRMRVNETVRDRFGAYSYYVEGLAEDALGRGPAAVAAFENLKDWTLQHGESGLATPGALVRLGYPGIAKDLLLRMPDKFTGDAHYWFLLFAAADALKEIDLMIEAGSKAHELAPANIIAVNNHAAALLINRSRPEEVIQMTLALLNRLPDAVVTRVNHAAALLMNKRVDEAESILRKIDLRELTREQLSLFRLDLFEVCLLQGKQDEARALAAQIETQFLYPPQRAWLASARQQLTSPQAALQ